MAYVVYRCLQISLLVSGISSQTDLCRFGDTNAGCVFTCLCTSGCDRQTGDCLNEGTCLLDDPSAAGIRRTGAGCRIGNVARGKPARQRGQWRHSHAGLAVDGVITSNIRQCAHPFTGPGNRAWWYVDLQKPYTVVSVTIFNRGGSRAYERTGNFRLGVGDVTDGDRTSLCKNYTGVVPEAGHDTIQCNTPVTGRYVTIIRTQGFEPQFLGLCEVMVHGYKPIVCDSNRCQLCSPLIGCDKCDPGYQYPDCKKECGEEEYGDNCGGRCSANCLRNQATSSRWCSLSDGRCLDGCTRGYWGDRCSKPCNDRCLRTGDWEVCNQNNGTCTQGCQIGYYGGICDNSCNSHCESVDSTQICERYSGVCSHGCQLPPYNTWYAGDHCNHSIYYVNYPGSNAINITGVTSDSVTIEWSHVEDIQLYKSAKFGYIIRTISTIKYENQSSFLGLSEGNVSSKYSHILEELSANTTYKISIAIYRQLQNGKTEESQSSVVTSVTTLAKRNEVQATSNTAGRSSLVGPAVGSVLGGLALIALVAILVVVILRRKRRLKSNENDAAEIESTPGSLSMKSSKDSLLEITDAPVGLENPGFEEQSSKKQSDELYYEFPAAKRPSEGTFIKVEDLEVYIGAKKYTKDGLKREYENIPKGELLPCDVAVQANNINKNRFKNIKAYDGTRVVLEVHEQGNYSDYINANFIKGYPNKANHYIATQGPKPETIYALWLMIWQCRSNRIIMATRIKELNKTKSEQYWPETVGEVKNYSDITVTTTACDCYADYNLSIITLQYRGEKRTVKHLHFLSWPDKEAPEHAFPLLAFRRKLRSFDNEGTGPIIVHCSAGIGRTGTFIALDYLLDQMKKEEKVDVFKLVTELRQERMNMVQTLSQYVFIYDALLEAYQQGETAISCNVYPERYRQFVDGNEYSNEVPIEDQFKILSKVKQHKASDDKLHALSKENRRKNRCADIVPDNKHRLFLSTTCPGTNDYINAVLVNSFLSENIFIVTQLPLPDTVVDFWRLVYEHDCQVVVTLDTPNNTEDCPKYWCLDKNEIRTFGKLEVRMDMTEDDEKGLTEERNFTLSYSSSDKSLSVRHILFKPWSDNQSLPDKEDALNLLECLQKLQQQREGGKIIIQCKDGAHRSGLICAANYMFEKMKADSEVDVFLAVRTVALHRNQFVNDLEQYRFLHDVAMEYMSRNQLYVNFK